MKIPAVYWIKLNNPISFYQNFPNFLNRFIFSRFQNVEKKKKTKKEIESENYLTMEITIFQERQ